MNKYMEYAEIKIPDEILNRLDKSASIGQPMTYGEAGLFEWLTKLSKEGGWRSVWQAYKFPYIVVEREVAKEAEEVEK
jgi:hypothetical protein